MYRRKIQLIAGSTYSISLPKEWVVKNKLKEKNEISLFEQNDSTLTISPNIIDKKDLEDISLDIDEHPEIDQGLFALYYLGFENIELYSKNKLDKNLRTKIRTAITNMSGTEITHEDAQKIKIKVLLDKSKLNIFQILYRIFLIIESSFSNIQGTIDKNEMRVNEEEVDRLYYLMVKIIQLSLINSNMLHSSKINNVSLIPSYFLIAKKLENIGDNIFHLSKYIRASEKDFENKKIILEFFKTELKRSVDYMISPSKNFKKMNSEELKTNSDMIKKIKDGAIFNYVKDIQRYILDIEYEIINVSFYNRLIKEKIL